MDVRAALRDVAEIGPFFAVERYPQGEQWRAFDTYLDDERHRRDRVAAARELLAHRAGLADGAIDERATASIQHLGTVARIVSPVLAVSAAHGRAPRLTPQNVRWRAIAGGPVEFAFTGDDDDVVDAVLNAIVVPLGDAFARTWHLSPHIVGGNAASALAGAATMLGRARPQLAAEARRVVTHLLDDPYLRGTGSWREDGTFRRNNCCLFYRIPGGGTCGDCVLTPR